MMRLNNKLLILSLCFLFFLHSQAQENNAVRIIGQMKDVMWKGEVEGKIHLDTIQPKEFLYGLGPMENLRGEILVMNGKSFYSTVVSDTEMKVEESFEIKAPFFGYAHIRNWTEENLPDKIENLEELETFLLQKSEASTLPYFFRLAGIVDRAMIHVVNLPEGSKVSSPKEAHQGQVNFEITGEEVEILGFFSTKHQAVFTHHDTYLHLHLITTDHQKMGHLDEVLFQKGSIKLYLPAD